MLACIVPILELTIVFARKSLCGKFDLPPSISKNACGSRFEVGHERSEIVCVFLGKRQPHL